MAVYKVPQDVEADDKLIGPFSFRQFVYLLVSGGLIALAAGLFQIFPVLAIIPLPPLVLFLALALPLKKDQPMETYLAAIVTYYLKPRIRRWVPGQKESTILITAPKKIEDVRTRDLSQEEATHRLSFLADIVDSEGYAIKGAAVNRNMRDDLVAEANATRDMFENYNSPNLSRVIEHERKVQHAEAIGKMRAAIDKNSGYVGVGMGPANHENKIVLDSQMGSIVKPEAAETAGVAEATDASSSKVQDAARPADGGSVASVAPVPGDAMAPAAANAATMPTVATPMTNAATMPTVAAMPAVVTAAPGPESLASVTPPEPLAPQASPVPAPQTVKQVAELNDKQKDSIMELANNSDYSVATIAKQANRVKRKDEGEIFISLH